MLKDFFREISRALHNVKQLRICQPKRLHYSSVGRVNINLGSGSYTIKKKKERKIQVSFKEQNQKIKNKGSKTRDNNKRIKSYRELQNIRHGNQQNI